MDISVRGKVKHIVIMLIPIAIELNIKDVLSTLSIELII